MSGLDDAMAGLRAAAAASDRTMRAATARGPQRTPQDRVRDLWRTGVLDTADIAEQLGVHESVVCGMLVRPGELRTESREDRA